MSLYGIYGSHTLEACPLYNPEVAKSLVAFAESDLTSLLSQHRIKEIVGQFHSALEHTFIWILDAEDAHSVEEFAFESGLAEFNTLKISPLKTFSDGVLPKARKLHGL